MPRSRSSRYSTTRQKSCLPCSSAKAKCDRNNTCGRCALRGLTCTYPASSSRDTSTLSEGISEPLFTIDVEEFQAQDTTETRIQNEAERMTEPASASNQPVDLVCPINSDDIKNRWLNSYVPLPGQIVKSYPSNVIKFVHRMLKSYASMAIRGRAPPFMHSTHLSLRPLSTCFTLIQICKAPLTGSETIISEIIQRDMTRLYEEHSSCSDMDLLGVFQAYLLYSLVLFFHLSSASMPFFRQVIMNLQEIACATARQGLVCIAEQQGTRPNWETWVLAEAKRRTLYTMYFLDNVLSAEDGLPTFIAHELKGLYAPSSKDLWQSGRAEWEQAYNLHLVEWVDGTFQLDELWPITEEMRGDEVERRQRRTDRWLEDVDEYGTMLYAVTSCTYGGPGTSEELAARSLRDEII